MHEITTDQAVYRTAPLPFTDLGMVVLEVEPTTPANVVALVRTMLRPNDAILLANALLENAAKVLSLQLRLDHPNVLRCAICPHMHEPLLTTDEVARTVLPASHRAPDPKCANCVGTGIRYNEGGITSCGCSFTYEPAAPPHVIQPMEG